MKKRLNKIPTNYTVALTPQEVTNLSETLSAVRTAGGGTGGVYIGDGQYIGVDNTNNKISFLPDAATKLESVSNKLDESTYAADSATFLTAHQSLSGYYQKTETSSKEQLSTEFEKYQTVAGMAEYLTTANAQTTYLTKSSAEENLAPISVTADVEVLKANSGDFSQYYKKTDTSSKEELSAEFDKYQTKEDMESYATDQDVVNLQLNLENLISSKQPKLTFGYNENNAISSINDSALAGQGGKTYSAGQYINIDSNDTISVTGLMALDEYAQYEPVLIGDANITATPSKVDNHTQWNLAINATPVVTNTKLTGQNCVTAHTTQVSGEWAVGLVQSAYEAIDSIDGISTDVGTLKTASSNWNKVSDKLDTTAFSTVSGTFLTTIPDTYATKEYANNASSNALNEAETWVENKHYLTSVPDTYALKTDIPTTVAELSDSGNYYQKTDTSSKTEITNAFNTKVDKPTSLQTGKLVYDGDTSAWVSLPAGTTTIVQGQGSVTANYDSISTYTISLLASAENALLDVNNKIDSTAVAQTYQTISDMANYLTTSDAADTYQPKGNYAPESVTATINTLTAASARWDEVSAKLGTAQYANDSATFVTSSSNTITGTKQYALTTAGWAVVQGGSTFTGVTTASPITGDGLNNTLGLDSNYKTAIEQVSGKVDKPADMTSNTPYCFSAGQWADMTQTYYSKTEATGTFLQKNLTNTLSGDGTSNNTLGVNWSNLSGNKIDSAKSADSAVYLTNGTNYSGFNDITGAINNKLNTNAIKTSAIGNTTYITAINTGSNDIPVKDTNFWDVNTTASTTAGNDNWQHYVTTSNTFNYYKMIVHPSGTTADNSWNNDNIIHIILEE